MKHVLHVAAIVQIRHDTEGRALSERTDLTPFSAPGECVLRPGA